MVYGFCFMQAREATRPKEEKSEVKKEEEIVHDENPWGERFSKRKGPY